MKSILLISNYKQGAGGISVQVGMLRSSLSGMGYPVSIFDTGRGIRQKLRATFRLRDEGRKYDVFHIHCCSGIGFFPAIIGIRAGRRLGKRVVLTYHGGGAEEFFSKHRKIVKRYLSRTDANIVLSGFLGEIFDRYAIPYIVIPNIIRLNGDIYRERNEIKPDFISIRTLRPIYNVICIVKAFQTVKAQVCEATLTIAGDGISRKELEQYVLDHQIKDVRFVGQVKNEDIYDFIDKADIMVSAARTDNMPVSVLEGFNAGVLVIASNVGGVPYMIEDGVNGYLFRDDDADELADKMMSAIMQPDNSIRMIHEAHASLGQYSEEAVISRITELYR